jgi:YgiT-type zinc finger domain-containing protein
METSVIPFQPRETRTCDCCGAEAVSKSLQRQTFFYGEKEHQTMLEAEVPVWTCATCGEAYTDEAGEIVRHAVVCDYLGRLPPAALVAIRHQHQMSQESWAELTGFGPASVKRWETGAQIQNAGADRFYRVLCDPAIVARLRFELTRVANNGQAQFQTRITEKSRAEAESFELRPSRLEKKAA